MAKMPNRLLDLKILTIIILFYFSRSSLVGKHSSPSILGKMFHLHLLMGNLWIGLILPPVFTDLMKQRLISVIFHAALFQS